MVEAGRHLILVYDVGQFTFRNIIPLATDEQIHKTGRTLNELQDTPVNKIIKVRQFMV